MRSFSSVTNASRARATAGKSRRTAATKSSNSFVPFSPRKDGEPEGSNPSRSFKHSFSNSRASRVSPKCWLAVDRKKSTAPRSGTTVFSFSTTAICSRTSAASAGSASTPLICSLFLFLRMRGERKARKSGNQTGHEEEGAQSAFHHVCLDDRKIILRKPAGLIGQAQASQLFVPVALGTRESYFHDALHGGFAARACPSSARRKN